MPVKDLIHMAVKNALLKDGWSITHDPFPIKYGELRAVADLGAQRVIAAEREEEKIAVEIKSFVGRSVMRDIEVALGQYLLYLSLLEKVEPERKLFLAISQRTFKVAFQGKAVQWLLQRNRVAIVVVDTVKEEVVTWIQN
jgi:hypothetical protein